MPAQFSSSSKCISFVVTDGALTCNPLVCGLLKCEDRERHFVLLVMATEVHLVPYMQDFDSISIPHFFVLCFFEFVVVWVRFFVFL